MDAHKHIQKAVAWLASEHKYFGELKEDLTQLRKDLETAQTKEQVTDIKKAFRDFRYLARSEQRFQRHEQQVEKALTELREQKIAASGTIQEIQDLLQQLHTEAANLIRGSSFYEGKIRELLTYLQVEIQEHQLEQAQAVLMEIMQVVDDAEKWLAALSTDLNKARKIFGESQELPDPNWEDFDHPETQRQIQALLVQRGFRHVGFWPKPQIADVYLQGYSSPPFSVLFRMWQYRKTKEIEVEFFRPHNLSWDRDSYALRFNPELERKRGRHFKPFLEKFLEIIEKATKQFGPPDVSKIIKQELG